MWYLFIFLDTWAFLVAALVLFRIWCDERDRKTLRAWPCAPGYSCGICWRAPSEGFVTHGTKITGSCLRCFQGE